MRFRDRVLQLISHGVAGDDLADTIGRMHDADLAATDARVRAECEAELESEHQELVKASAEIIRLDAQLAALRTAGENLAEELRELDTSERAAEVDAALAAWNAPAPGDKAKCGKCGSNERWCAANECPQLGGRGNRDRRPGQCSYFAPSCDSHQPCPDCATGGGA
jgi:hypothetical protein